MPTTITACLGGLCIAAMSASGFTGYGYLQQKHIAEEEQAAVEKTERTNDELQAAIYRLADQFNVQASEQINEAQVRVNVVGNEIASQLERERDDIRAQLDRLLAWHKQLQREQAYAASLVNTSDPDKVQTGIERWLTLARYPEPMKNALLDRIDIESGFNPQAVSPTGGFKCLIQWDSVRYRNLLRFARYTPSRDRPCPRWDYQIAFVDHELKTERIYRAAWRASGSNAYHTVTAVYFRGVE